MYAGILSAFFGKIFHAIFFRDKQLSSVCKDMRNNVYTSAGRNNALKELKQEGGIHLA